MHQIRLLCCAVLAAVLATAYAQTPPPGDKGDGGKGTGGFGTVGNNGHNPPPPPGTDTLRFATVPEGGFADGQKVTKQVQFLIIMDSISPGHNTRLKIKQDAGSAAKNFEGPTCPDGCIPQTWNPCANFTVGGPFPDGAYTCTAEIYDAETGVTVPGGAAVIHIVLDNTVPVVSSSLTPNKSCYGKNDKNVQWKGTATDANGLSSYDISGNGLPNESVNGPFASPLNVNKTIDMSLKADGTYTITFLARDNAGFVGQVASCRTGPNEADDSLTFKVDTTAPVVDVTAPGSCLKGKVMLHWTESNAPATTNLTSTRVLVDGFVKATLAPGTLQYELDTTTLADGNHTLKIEVDDECGNTGSASSPFSTDNTVPTITVTSPGIINPANCQEVGGPSVALAFSFSENVNWTLSVDGGTSGLTNTAGSGLSGNSVWTPGDEDVCHNFLITAVDACNNTNTKTFILKIRKPGDCTCTIVPNLIWVGAAQVTDPFDGSLKGTFRPEVINIDGITIRDLLNCHGVVIDQNLIVQAVCVKKHTPVIKCAAFTDGPGSDLNTNFNTGPQFATNQNLDDPICNVAFHMPSDDECLGNRCLLFSPPCTEYTLCVIYVLRDPVTGRIGAPITKEMCWKVEIPTKEAIKCNIEYFETVALGRTQKCKITPDVAESLCNCLAITDDLEALICFESVLGNFSIDFLPWLKDNKGDVRFAGSYIVDSDEEPVACLLWEQALSILFHP